jgi:AraC-like DNA-binding protein
MNHDFYTNRSRSLLLSGYPLELTRLDSSLISPDEAKCHRHDEIELIYISQGNVCASCADIDILAGEGDILFINQDVEHFVTFEGGTSEIYSIVINPSFILDFEQLELENKYVHPIICDSTFSHLHVSKGDAVYDQFITPLSNIIELNLSHTNGYELLSRSYIIQLWKLIYDIFNNRFPTNAPSTHGTKVRTSLQNEQRVRQACIYIHEHFTEPITLEDIADSILVSKSECCRCFKRVCSMSPFEYLMKYRIERASINMQLNTSNSIADIAGSVGFNNISYFNKVFKKFMGCTPSEYKKSL